MDSTIFNRRTLLGSGALVGLGALLAACGQQANNEAAATASAAPEQADGLYLFTTVTCPNCKIAKNELEKAGLHYTTMDVSEHMDLVTEYGIQQAPTLIVRHDGQVEKLVNASTIKKYAVTHG